MDVGVHVGAFDADDGAGAGLAFGDDDAEGFADAGVNEEVCDAVVVGEFCGFVAVGDPVEVGEFFLCAEEVFLELAVADDEEGELVRAFVLEDLKGFEEEFGVFFAGEASDVEEEEGVVGDVEGLAGDGEGFGGVEDFSVDAEADGDGVFDAPLGEEVCEEF